MITTIIFDLSEVYLQGIFGSHTHLEKKLGFPVSDEYFYTEEFNQFMLGQISEDTYWKTVIKNNSWNISVEALKQTARKNFTEIKGTREIIEKLKDLGYTLILLSNHGKEWIEYCEEKYSYHKLFHHSFYSYQLKLSKPDKEIFTTFLKKLQLKPQECLFIDDHEKNILAAKQLHFNTIKFISSKDLQQKLIKYLDLK